ncbi:hypothetical protein PHIN3_48 [Sinorhizobium phage phiN3]|uniref:Uncharacterized protein n=1 Tax=Sinorhizobium phage phiN3 TaxID=1647405 RepID=A0A0F6SIZ5_9CAUD|nr:hypothetical protein AVT40_gp048 [Sinorhizobium phage phiN3]AKF13313.1 hypothetical protein PHIN3_48 [Sinorhizobium phage phiN3]
MTSITIEELDALYRDYKERNPTLPEFAFPQQQYEMRPDKDKPVMIFLPFILPNLPEEAPDEPFKRMPFSILRHIVSDTGTTHIPDFLE